MEKWNSIYVGIQLCLAAQLTIVGFANLFEAKARNIFLGIYCILIAQSPLILAFPEELKSYTLTIIFVWAWKGFFYGPLLYLFISSLNRERGKKHYLKHLIIPFLLYCTSLFKLFFIEERLTATVFNNIKYYSYWAIIVVYFYWGLKEFSYYLKDKLEVLSKARFFSFYVIVNLHLVSSILPGLILVLSKHTSIIWIDKLGEAFAVPFYSYFVVPFYLVLIVFLIYFGITELRWIKNYFPKSTIYAEEKYDQAEIDSIKDRINELVESNEFFKNRKVTINDLSKLSGLSQKSIRKFLSEQGYTTFNDFINRLRIDDVKTKLSGNINSHYDFVSLAKESGFQSKATFYRVFKQQTGKTPSSFIEYINKLDGEN